MRLSEKKIHATKRVQEFYSSLNIIEKILLLASIILVCAFFIIALSLNGEKQSSLRNNIITLPSSEVNAYNYTVYTVDNNSYITELLFSLRVNEEKLSPDIVHIRWSTKNVFNITTSVALHDSSTALENYTFHYSIQYNAILYILCFIYCVFISAYFVWRQKLKIIIKKYDVVYHFFALLIPYVLSIFICILFGIHYLRISLFNQSAFEILQRIFQARYALLCDFLILTFFYICITILSNNKKRYIVICETAFIVYFFIIQNAVLTFQNTLMSSSNMVIFASSAFETLTTMQQVGVMSFLVIITLSLLYVAFQIIKTLCIRFSITKCITLIVAGIMIVLYLSFKLITIESWAVDYQETAYRHGIFLTKNYDIHFKKESKITITEEDVKKSLALVQSYQENRNIDSLLLESTKNSLATTGNAPTRDVYLIFLESFYDYSHFQDIFTDDPFSDEYRMWANASQKIGPDTEGGSFYARLAGLTGSSPLYPSRSTMYDTLLPQLFSDKGYDTFALEEASPTYNLGQLLPAFQFSNVTFDIGNTNLLSYIENNILPLETHKFVYAFTYLGHTGSWNNDSTEIREKHKVEIDDFLQYFTEADNIEYNLVTSIQTANTIIRIRNTILKTDPDALIIFKHDHLYPVLKNTIQTSSLPNEQKNAFLNSPFVNPLLIWDGQNGAFKAPIGFTGENIPLFIALNAGLEYKNSIPSLLYKETIDSQVASHNNYYNLSDASPQLIKTKDAVSTELLELEMAVKVLSEDVFKGKGITYTILDTK